MPIPTIFNIRKQETYMPQKNQRNRRQFAATAIGLAAALSMGGAIAQSKDIKIAQIASLTGLAEAYGKQSVIGLQMGLEYATKGTMAVAGRKLVVVVKDDQSKPDVAKAKLLEAFGDEKADVAVGANSTPATLALMPVAEEYKKILLIDSAISDSITGDKWNKYIFRVKQNSTQDNAASAAAFDGDGVSIATLSQDSAYGKEGITAFKVGLSKAKILHEEYVPVSTTDFTAAAQRLIEKLRTAPGRKVIFINSWFGPNDPFKVADAGLDRYGIELGAGGNILPVLAQYKRAPGMEGGTTYFYELPKNAVNDWLVAEHQKRHGTPPDIFQVMAFSSAMALVSALEKTGGDPNTNKLINAMEGLTFSTPKGPMTFRKEDHQAMQSMYHYKIAVKPDVAWGIPTLVREIKPDELKVPVLNKR
jgi:branched-chain amino acid transport system substrate-binding protein